MSRKGHNFFPRNSGVQPTFQSPQNNAYPLNPSRLLQDNNPAQVLKNPQIQNIVTQSNQQDIILYEYEIVDKKAEDKYINETVRNKGLCLCQRWLFVLVGNLIIIIFVCALLGLLVYMNTTSNASKKPASYLDTCTVGSSDCDTVADLKCPNGTCLCNGNKLWNGTDCTCLENYYWDGFYCLPNKLYSESCSSSDPCMDYLVCDSTTNQCACSSTKYYNNSYCVDKKPSGQSCSSYIECQTYLGLTCSSGKCQCYYRYYWDSTTCTPQLLDSQSCAAFPTIQCDTSLGLSCQSTFCSCNSNYWWNGTICQIKGTYGVSCTSNIECDSSKYFICSTASCNCPNSYPIGSCDCDPSTRFYDGASCITRKTTGFACPGNYGCTSNLCSIYGLCQ